MGIMMADKKTDDTLEDVPSDEDSSNVASKGLSKPTLIKIAIGLLTLLIIAGGAYFFFISSDEPTSEEAAAETSEPIISPELASSTPSSETPPINKEYTAEDIHILKMREEAVALKEENLQMKERLSKLEGQQNPNVETTGSEVEIPESAINATAPEEVDKKTTEVTAKPKEKTNQYSNLYSRDYTTTREPQREPTPPPEPKWGSFEPPYRGK